MESSKKGRLVADRLSALPDDILVHILSFTESHRTAVKCSVLSKRWISLHNQLPRLFLTYRDYFSDNKEIWERRSEDHCRYQIMVHKALSLHTQALESLFLEYANRGGEKILPMSISPIQYAAAMHVQRLKLKPFDFLDRFNHLLSCTNLKSLELDNCSIPDFFFPASFAGFPYLTKFSLKVVTLGPQIARSLLDKFPVVESLVLNNVWEEQLDSGVSFSSKTLQSLVVEDMPLVEVQATCPQLKKITVRVSTPHNVVLLEGNDSSNSYKLPRNILPWVHHAQLSENGDLTDLYLDCAPAKSLEDLLGFTKLQDLSLSNIYACPTLIWKAVTGVPHLRYLLLQYCVFLDGNEVVEETKDAASLREVRINIRYPGPGDSQMLALVTKRCPMLEKLVFTRKGSQHKMVAGYGCQS